MASVYIMNYPQNDDFEFIYCCVIFSFLAVAAQKISSGYTGNDVCICLVVFLQIWADSFSKCSLLWRPDVAKRAWTCTSVCLHVCVSHSVPSKSWLLITAALMTSEWFLPFFLTPCLNTQAKRRLSGLISINLHPTTSCCILSSFNCRRPYNGAMLPVIGSPPEWEMFSWG